MKLCIILRSHRLAVPCGMESALRADGNGILAGMEKQFEVQRRSAEDLRHAADGEPDLAVSLLLMGRISHGLPLDSAAGVPDLLDLEGLQSDRYQSRIVDFHLFPVGYLCRVSESRHCDT